MSTESVEVQRPDRWDHPLSTDMSDDVVEQLLANPPFSLMDAERFGRQTPLRDVLKNDTRLHSMQPGDFVFREGQYGGSAYLVLSGDVRIFLAELLPGSAAKRSWGGVDWLHFLRKKKAASTPKQTGTAVAEGDPSRLRTSTIILRSTSKSATEAKASKHECACRMFLE